MVYIIAHFGGFVKNYLKIRKAALFLCIMYRLAGCYM